ncbi:MAG: hypothetical protein ACR2MG_19920 [Pyrinomonadaceae bacterium]
MKNLVFSSEGNTLILNVNFPQAAKQPSSNDEEAQFQDAQPLENQYQLPQFSQPSFQPPFNQTPVFHPPNRNGYYDWSQNNQQNHPQFYSNQQSQGAWKNGSHLVVHKNGLLPDRCVKCNDSVTSLRNGHNIRQKFRWHNPLVYIALISPLIYVILASVLSQTVYVDLPICSRHLEERNSVKNYLLGGGVFAFLAVFFFSYFGAVGMAILISIASIVGLSLAYEYMYKPLKINKIENDYIYLQGADKSFLESLPYC